MEETEGVLHFKNFDLPQSSFEPVLIEYEFPVENLSYRFPEQIPKTEIKFSHNLAKLTFKNPNLMSQNNQARVTSNYTQINNHQNKRPTRVSTNNYHPEFQQWQQYNQAVQPPGAPPPSQVRGISRHLQSVPQNVHQEYMNPFNPHKFPQHQIPMLPSYMNMNPISQGI